MNADRTQCKKCLYRTESEMRSVHYCDYFSMTGELRHCEPSPNCTKFEKYNKKKRALLRMQSKIRNNPNSLCRQRSIKNEK